MIGIATGAVDEIFEASPVDDLFEQVVGMHLSSSGLGPQPSGRGIPASDAWPSPVRTTMTLIDGGVK